MIVNTLEKQPSEIKQYAHDFSPELGPDSVILTATVLVEDMDGVDVTDTLLVTGSADFEGNTLYWALQGGAAGSDYKVTLTAQSNHLVGTATNETAEVEYLVEVRDW